MSRARRSFDVGSRAAGAMDLLDKKGKRTALTCLGSGIFSRAGRSQDDPLPVVFEEQASGLLRVAHREMVIRFEPAAPGRRRRAILGWYDFEVLRRNAFIADQVVVGHPGGKYAGEDLIEIANRLIALDEVELAAPAFLSQYRREAPPSILPQEWHLGSSGLGVQAAWKVTTGDRGIVVAVLDDGVDVDHPALTDNLWRNPDPSARDRTGRDFFLPDDHPGHFDPRPKRFQFPFDRTKGNDLHGTACAGLIAAGGIGYGSVGVAPGCRFLPVKIFLGDALVPDERVADAIRYAAIHADALCCSWTGSASPDVALALEDAGRLGRQGRGSAVFCAAGNDGGRVAFPARDPHAIAVGAVTDQGERAAYSNTGPEVAILAPSSGGERSIFTTDISIPGRGYNPDGLYTNRFGGTSAATALAAGVGALVLSVRPALSREELAEILKITADAGRLDACRAVEETLEQVK
ncbi:MAG TPA: S8 family serine peptidase [Thermoanaerobaculia bacterium]|nr:S8 family serine peptidase [Thermoanaerobaculia bacterium]